MNTPVNSPFRNAIEGKTVDNEQEEIPMTYDLLFPTTAKEVRHMLNKVQYHKMWIPTQASITYLKSR